MAVKNIGILTSGGDCAGLNAVLRGAVLRAHLAYDWGVTGIHQGLHGLLARPILAETLNPARFDAALLRQGGTVLGTTNRGNPFAWPLAGGATQDRSAEILAAWRSLGLDALIAIGGDGSLAILRRLAQQGAIPLVGVPKTIDNDLGHTEFAVGHSTAVEVATQALDSLQSTGASHGRIMVLEVMGRDAGHIALNAGVAGGADAILIPEIPSRLSSIAHSLQGRASALVVVAEAAKPLDLGARPAGPGRIGQSLAEALSETTGHEARATVLGHLQRGGEPVSRDRIIGQTFGALAVDLVAEGRFDHMVAWSGRRAFAVPLAEAIAHNQTVDPADPLVAVARGLGIVFGDEESTSP